MNTEPTQQTDPNQQQQNVQPQGISPELIKQAVIEGFQTVNAPVAKTVDTMTPEERAKYFEIFDPTQDGFVDSFTKAFNEAESPEERAKVLAKFRDGVVNQSLRGAEIMLEEKLGKLQQQFAPAQQFAAQQQQEALWDAFSTAHPELGQNRELVDAVATQLAATGYRPKDQNEAFSKIAETAKTILTKSGVQLPANTNSGTRPAMAQMSSRGASGGPAPVQQNTGRGVAKFWQNRRG